MRAPCTGARPGQGYVLDKDASLTACSVRDCDPPAPDGFYYVVGGDCSEDNQALKGRLRRIAPDMTRIWRTKQLLPGLGREDLLAQVLGDADVADRGRRRRRRIMRTMF